MERNTIGRIALALFGALLLLTILAVVSARMTPEEASAVAALRRATCDAKALTFDAQLACGRIQPEAGFIMARLNLAGFFGLAALITLGFALAMLAKPNADRPADMGSQAERARQRRLALAAQEKLRAERLERDGTS